MRGSLTQYGASGATELWNSKQTQPRDLRGTVALATATTRAVWKSSSRTAASKALLSYGMRFFETHRIYAAGEEVTRVRVWKGSPESVALTTRDDLYVTVPRGRYDELAAAMNIQTELMAPLPGDMPVGELEISLDDEPILNRPLYPSQTVDEGGLWTRLYDTVLLWFE